MLIISFIFFYTFPSSVIFLHGIGMERLSMNARSIHTLLPFILRDGILILFAASISWLITSYVFTPLGITTLMPLFALLIVRLCDFGLQYLPFRHMKKRMTGEQLFSGGTVIFALYHAFTYIELLAIILSAIIGMILWSLVLYAVKLRIEQSTVLLQWKNTPLLLMSMGMITLALYAWDGTLFTPLLP